MALWGNGVSTQIITVPSLWFTRGRDAFTAALWARCASTLPSSGNRNFWRQDGTFTALQNDTSNNLRPVWWNSSGSAVNNPPSVHYGLSTAVTLDVWTFFLFSYSRTGIACYRYVPGAGIVQATSPATWASSIRGSGTSITNVFAGSEGGSELLPTGCAMGEVMLLDTVIPASQIRQLAHDPASFRESLAFYAPLRDAGRRTTELVSGRRHELRYGTTSRAQILAAEHPPVEAWRGRSYAVAWPLPRYSSAAIGLTARKHAGYLPATNPRLPIIR